MRIRVLFIAYHFPPLHGSSGILRTLKFVKYSPEFDIEPLVLTVKPYAYEMRDSALCSEVPEDVHVHRTIVLDTKRHLSFRGRYLDIMATPDRFISWIPTGVIAGIKLILQKKIDVIFSTAPIPSAHIIALALKRIMRKPWVADFRDPLWDEYFQVSSKQLQVRKQIERTTVNSATRIIVTTEGMRQLFVKRYPKKNPKDIIVIENGYDESDFQGLNGKNINGKRPFRLIHTGLLYPLDRNPIPFFRAIKRSVEMNRILMGDICIELYSPGNEVNYAREIENLGIQDLVCIHPQIPYRKALIEMNNADVLLLFQGKSCNQQIPAKLYEYIRIGRPILAMTPHNSETARVIRSANAGQIVPLDDSEAISLLLSEWICNLKSGKKLPNASPDTAQKYCRRTQAAELSATIREIFRNQWS